MDGDGRIGLAVLIGVWATFALDCFSTFTSSPQTTELAANERKHSLVYWVGIGSGVAIGGGLIAAIVSRRISPLIVTGAVAGAMVLLYTHAAARGSGQATPGSVA